MKKKKKKESYDLDYDILTIENYKMLEGWSRNPNEQKFNYFCDNKCLLSLNQF